jgi:hypothetical protein
MNAALVSFLIAFVGTTLWLFWHYRERRLFWTLLITAVSVSAAWLWKSF